MKVYVASGATAEEVTASRDDAVFDLSLQACANFGGIYTTFEKGLEAMRKSIEESLFEEFDMLENDKTRITWDEVRTDDHGGWSQFARVDGEEAALVAVVEAEVE